MFEEQKKEIERQVSGDSGVEDKPSSPHAGRETESKTGGRKERRKSERVKM